MQAQATVTGNKSITVKATATDDAQTTLYYTLRYSTSQSSLDTTTTIMTTEEQKEQQVTFDVTGLSNYTTYYYRVDVSDGLVTEITKGTPGQVTTLCGLATHCSGGTPPYNCPTCGYSGTVTSGGGTGRATYECTGSVNRFTSGGRKM